MQKSTSSSSRRPRSRSSTARRPGAPNTSATKRIFSGPTSVAAGLDLDRHVVARVLGVAGERLALERGQVEDGADLRARRSRRGADRERRVRAQVRSARRRRTARSGAGCRCARRAPGSEHEVGDPDDRAVDRRVDVGAGRGADVERGGARARGEPLSWYQTSRSCSVPARRCQSRARRPGVPLRADRLERAGAVGGAVVADRGHRALGDGQLDAQRAGRRDDLGLGWPPGRTPDAAERLRRRGRGWSRRRSGAGSRASDRRTEDGEEDPARVPLRDAASEVDVACAHAGARRPVVGPKPCAAP